MAVSRYFGLPGCGKTTTLTMLALQAIESGRYDNVYCNVRLKVPGVTWVEFDVLGKYDLHDCLVLIDEAMVNCGDRDYKDFGKEKIRAFVEHRHHRMDIVLFSQEPDGIDKKIRSITDRMYYVKKGWLLGKWFSSIVHIPYGLVWPTEQSNGENLGRIVMGYMKPPFLLRLFAKRIYRPKYYPYFDSWEVTEVLPPLPSYYSTYFTPLEKQPLVQPYRRCYKALAKWHKQYKRRALTKKLFCCVHWLPKKSLAVVSQ